MTASLKLNALNDLPLPPSASKSPERDYIQQWKLQQSAIIVAASSSLGIIYPAFSDGFHSAVPFINGVVIGLLGGISISAIELFLFPDFKRSLSMLQFILLKCGVYMFVITWFVFSVILISRSIQLGLSIKDTFHSDQFRHFIFEEDFIVIVFYALSFAVIVIFMREMSAKLGQGMLLNYISGHYRKPHQEKRIFMFLDINSSVEKGESLGDLKYHAMLNDFFFDLTDSILMTKGEIYQYVGDQVVITWPVNNSTRADNCIRLFTSCTHKIHSLRHQYMIKYGTVPTFKAAVHVGMVIHAEIGAVKSEIVFHGDVVNTTARLERLCSERNERMLISSDLFEMLSAEGKNRFERTGELNLRGKSQTIEIHRLRPFATLNRTSQLNTKREAA
jgi:adenylate cyclase